MTAATREAKIDAIMEQASQALAETRYFEAERLAWQLKSSASFAQAVGSRPR